MHFSLPSFATALAILSLVSPSFATPIADVSPLNPLITAAPLSAQLEARAPSKQRKYTRPKPPPRKCPIKHPKGCTNTELLKNGDLNKNTRGWTTFSTGPGSPQFFSVKNSKQRPSHSGGGSGLIFLGRGYAVMDMTTRLPAVEFGNSITISMWMRYDGPTDLSSCQPHWSVRGYTGAILEIALTTEWKKYSFEVPGMGRDEELRFVMLCTALDTPTYVYLDDVSAKACVPKNPSPECQVVTGSNNLLVNPGFECEDGITAWQTQSNSGGNDSLMQFGPTRNNPIHSGKGMGGFVYDSSMDAGFTGLAIFQWDIVGDLTRQYMKASFWLSADAKANMAGCQLSVSTRTGYYLYGVDISDLTTKWKKFEIKDIVPDSLDDFMIDISWCTSKPFPVIYIDDVYFGTDEKAPPATPTTTPTEPTPTPGPCTSAPTLVDPSLELGDEMNNWMQGGSFDVIATTDNTGAYGPAHDGDGVAVIQLPPQSSASFTQYTSGFCPNGVYTVSAWFKIPTGYDPFVCQFRIGVTTASELLTVSQAGVWQKLEVVFLVDEFRASDPFLTLLVGIFCDNPTDMVVLFDDIRYGPAPQCTTTPSIADGGFESGNLANFEYGGFQGDEKVVITNDKPHSGKKSLMATFPSISNGISMSHKFTACVGTRYTFKLWYYMPKSPKNNQCYVNLAALFTLESSQNLITLFDQWVEATFDVTAEGENMEVFWSVVCANQLQKVVVYVDDVSVAKKT